MAFDMGQPLLRKPCCIAGIGDGRKGIFCFLAGQAVQKMGQVTCQQPHGPAVHDDVVQPQNQGRTPVLRMGKDCCPPQWGPGEIIARSAKGFSAGLDVCLSVRLPSWLEDEAKKEWKRMAKVLEQMGLLTEMDMAAFAGYCQAYARWKEAEEFLTQHGSMVRTPNGYLQQVPQVSIAQTNMKIMLKFCEQFGLTPSARSRIVGGENSDEEDEMEKLLEGGGC